MGIHLRGGREWGVYYLPVECPIKTIFPSGLNPRKYWTHLDNSSASLHHARYQ